MYLDVIYNIFHTCYDIRPTDIHLQPDTRFAIQWDTVKRPDIWSISNTNVFFLGIFVVVVLVILPLDSYRGTSTLQNMCRLPTSPKVS